MDAAKTAKPGRLESLDAFRGAVILVMILVNHLAGMKDIAPFLLHAPANGNTITLADMVYPGFLFIVGVSIPFAFQKRLASGESLLKLAWHVVSRGASLVFLGVILVNMGSYSPERSAMPKELWYFLAYASTFMIWSIRPKDLSPAARMAFTGLKACGFASMGALLWIFSNASGGWLEHSWWGILGTIGWCYMECALLFLLVRGDLSCVVGSIAFMTALYIGGKHGGLAFAKPLVGDFISIGNVFGSHGAIVAAGMAAGSILMKNAGEELFGKRLLGLALLGSALLSAGFVLRPLHSFSKIWGTESYCLATAGISCLSLMAFHWLIDVMKLRFWTLAFIPIGMNPLLAYLLPDFLNCALKLAGVKAYFWPWWSLGGLWGFANAALMTALVLVLAWTMTRFKIILKL